MENESPRRRVRRAKQSRPVAPGHAEPVAGAVGHPSPSSEVADQPVAAVEATPVSEPEIPADFPIDGQDWAPEELPDSSRDGAWLPAGIAVLVIVSLLVCAGLVLIASRQ